MEKSSGNKNYEKYVEDPNYRPLTSDDISWYLKQKSNNKELQKVEHISIDLENNLYARIRKAEVLKEFDEEISSAPSEKERKLRITRARLHDTVAYELFKHMQKSLQQSGNNNFCKKLLISNTDGCHTYAFIYGLYNGVPFCTTFSNHGSKALNSAMQISKNSSNELEVFENSEFCIYSVTDTKSCGAIALKIMKYLKEKDIQSILDKNAIITTKKGEKYFSPQALPRRLVQYIQSIDNIQYHDKYNDKYTNDIGKYPARTIEDKYLGTVYDKIKSKDRIKIGKDKKTNQDKEVNTTAEVKQKQIINRMTVEKGTRTKNVEGITI